MVLFPAGTGQPCPWTCYPLPWELLPGPADAPGTWLPGDEPPRWPGQADESHCPPSWCFSSPRLLSLLRRAVLSGACTRGCLVPLLPPLGQRVCVWHGEPGSSRKVTPALASPPASPTGRRRGAAILQPPQIFRPQLCWRQQRPQG